MTAEFSINKWFNDLPIRVVGSPDEPFFYAADLAAVLGIKNVSTSIANFTEDDIVSEKQRRKHNITTYKKYRNTMRPDPTLILLTDAGAYKLIYNSKSPVAKDFKKFITGLIRAARSNDPNALDANEHGDINDLLATNVKLTKDLKAYKSKLDILYLFKKRIDGDPYKFIPEKEVDAYMRDASARYGPPEIAKNLYKLTRRPEQQDYRDYTLYATINDTSKLLLEEINEEYTIPLTEEANKYCRYYVKKPILDDLTGISIEYH